MLTILVFFIILSILVVIHELGHFIAAKKNNVYVEEFGFGLPPRIFGIRRGETLYSINLLPFGGFVKLLGEEEHELGQSKLPKELQNRTFVSKKPWQKIVILTAGVFANFLLGWFVMSYLFTQGIPTPTNKVIVESVSENSPADLAGIEKGDVVTEIQSEGQTISVKDIDHFVAEVKKLEGKPIGLRTIRNDSASNINLTPREDPPEGEGALGVVLTPIVIVTYPWYQAPFYGLVESAKLTAIITREIGRVLAGLVTFQALNVDVAGPVGIAKVTSQAIQYGHTAVLQLLGLLSLNLAVINILPFPALDGGRLAFVLYEITTRRKINPQIEKRLNLIGFAILLSLIVLVTIHDISKL